MLPSVAEGMSNSLLEAMATALPCVVSGIGGNTDLVADGITGRLVSTGDASAGRALCWSSSTTRPTCDDTAKRHGNASTNSSPSTWSSTAIWIFTAG